MDSAPENLIKIQHLATFNWLNALRGMRNPLESWSKSDSQILEYSDQTGERPQLGESDLQLAMKLIKAGSSHRKFLRQIFVSMDITAPLYWWKEMDTYKVATTANSTSTMHKLSATPIQLDSFSFDDPDNDLARNLIPQLEGLRQQFQATKDPKTWRLLIQLLPLAWQQTRTWSGDYETILNIFTDRSHHKLVEWRMFCQFIQSQLPYLDLFLTHLSKP